MMAGVMLVLRSILGRLSLAILHWQVVVYCLGRATGIFLLKDPPRYINHIQKCRVAMHLSSLTEMLPQIMCCALTHSQRSSSFAPDCQTIYTQHLYLPQTFNRIFLQQQHATLTLHCATGTNGSDVNDSFGKDGSFGSQGARSPASTAQTFGGSITGSKQSGEQTGGPIGKAGGGKSQEGSGKQGGGHSSGVTGGQVAARDASKSLSGGSTGTSLGQGAHTPSPHPLLQLFSHPLAPSLPY